MIVPGFKFITLSSKLNVKVGNVPFTISIDSLTFFYCTEFIEVNAYTFGYTRYWRSGKIHSSSYLEFPRNLIRKFESIGLL